VLQCSHAFVFPVAPSGAWGICETLRYTSVSQSYRQSVGLLGRGISPSKGRYLHTEQHKHIINAHRHPCLEWDSNPRSKHSSERRQFMRGHCDQPIDTVLEQNGGWYV
jgi:hypothetical protein